MKKKKILYYIIDLFAAIIIVFCLYKIGNWFYDNHKVKKTKDSYKDTQDKIDDIDINKVKEDTISIKELKKDNEDTVAWLKVNNTKISYPVVRATDNDYYLNKSFDKSYNSAGWIFMDYKNKLDGTDKNIVIYGHNRKNGDMFGTLSTTLKEEWYTNDDNKEILLITEQEIQRYEVFSVYEIKNEEYYITTDFTNKNYSDFLNTIKERSIYDFNTSVSEDKNILTLSTCSGNDKYRTVLHAIKK